MRFSQRAAITWSKVTPKPEFPCVSDGALHWIQPASRPPVERSASLLEPMRFPRLLLLLVTVTVLNVHRGTADPDPNDEV